MPVARTEKPLSSRLNQLIRYELEPGADPLVIQVHWIEDAGRMICVGIEVWKGVEPAPDGFSVRPLKGAALDGFAATDLRKIPLATIIDDAWKTQQLAENASRQHMQDYFKADLPAELKGLLEEPNPFDGPRRRVSPDDVAVFRKVADIYSDALASPGRKRPTQAVQDAMGVSYSTATKWVRQARVLHYLSDTSPGRPSALAKPTKRPKGKKS